MQKLRKNGENTAAAACQELIDWKLTSKGMRLQRQFSGIETKINQCTQVVQCLGDKEGRLLSVLWLSSEVRVVFNELLFLSDTRTGTLTFELLTTRV